jgi:hypothetical protein
LNLGEKIGCRHKISTSIIFNGHIIIECVVGNLNATFSHSVSVKMLRYYKLPKEIRDVSFGFPKLEINVLQPKNLNGIPVEIVKRLFDLGVNETFVSAVCILGVGIGVKRATQFYTLAVVQLIHFLLLHRNVTPTVEKWRGARVIQVLHCYGNL